MVVRTNSHADALNPFLFDNLEYSRDVNIILVAMKDFAGDSGLLERGRKIGQTQRSEHVGYVSVGLDQQNIHSLNSCCACGCKPALAQHDVAFCANRLVKATPA